MKRLLFLLLLFTNVHTDAQVYHPMLNNTSWYLVASGFGGKENLWISPIYDTVISGLTYKKYTRYTATGTVGESCFLREDSSLQTVYYRYDALSPERLLYDFSTAIGQTQVFYLPWFGGNTVCHLDTVSIINTCYGPRRFQTWSFPSVEFSTLEQFGSVNDDPTWVHYGGEPYVRTVCKFEGNSSCYFPWHTNPNNDSTLICPSGPFGNVSGINGADFDGNYSAFPNPFSNHLVIEIPNSEQTKVTIYNVLSEQILKQTFVTSTTINTEQFLNGIYFYELRNAKGIVKSGKVIKY